MREEWRKYLTRNAPRYTSYPSALNFDAGVDEHVYGTALQAIELYDPLSIYVHVPFCRRLCFYCGCNMRVENRYARALPYLDALRREIALVSHMLAGRGRPASLHFGGGTPNFFTPDDLETIIHEIEGGLGLTNDCRMAIELDPRLCADDDIAALARIGFTRMSLGVQDFDARVQTAINRVQSVELIAACVEQIRAAGIGDLSFDLLYGLPYQTRETFTETVRKAIDLSPDRISLFGYAHMPSKIRRQGRLPAAALPTADERAALRELADQMFADAGYERIGFDHYARPDNTLAVAAKAGRLARNFQGFTDDATEKVIGFGASAISFVDGVYAQNAATVEDYNYRIGEGRLATARGCVRSPDDARFAAIIRDLLCAMKTDLRARLGASVRAENEIRAIKRNLAAMAEDGLVALSGDIVTAPEEARGFLRVIAAAVDPRVSPVSETGAEPGATGHDGRFARAV